MQNNDDLACFIICGVLFNEIYISTNHNSALSSNSKGSNKQDDPNVLLRTMSLVLRKPVFGVSDQV